MRQRFDEGISLREMKGRFDCGVLVQFLNRSDPNIFLDGSIELGKSLEHSGQVRMVFIGFVSANVDTVDEEGSFVKLDDSENDLGKGRFSCRDQSERYACQLLLLVTTPRTRAIESNNSKTFTRCEFKIYVPQRGFAISGVSIRQTS